MAKTEAGITFQELRRIVTALHDKGTALKESRLTFSHGNIGNEFLEICHSLDALVADSEPYKKFLIIAYDLYEKEKDAHSDYRREQYQILAEWQRFARELGEIFDIQGGTTDDYLKRAKALVDYLMKNGQRERRGSLRISDLERAVDKIAEKSRTNRTDRKRGTDRRKETV